MKAGIAVDNWKLPVFREQLTKAGYKYEDGGAVTGDVTLLTVVTDDLVSLRSLLERCQAICRTAKRSH